MAGGPGTRPASLPPRPTARQLIAAAAAVLIALLPATGPARNAHAADETSPDPVREVLEFLAAVEGLRVVTDGQVVKLVDPEGDSGASWGHDDLTGAAMGFLPEVPDWLLDGPFSCGADNTACPSTGSMPDAFADGAYLFYQRLVSPPGVIPAGQRGEWGPVLALDQYPPAPSEPGNPFSGASHAVITRVEGSMRDVLYFAYLGQFGTYRTSARSMWSGNEIMTLVPRATEVQTDILAWDTYAFGSDGTSTGRDMARDLAGGELMPVDSIPEIRFEEAAVASIAPTPTPTPSPAPSSPSSPASAPASPTAAPTASATAAPTGGAADDTGLAGLWDNLLVRLVLGMLLAVIGLVLLLGWLRRRSGGPPDAGPGPASPGGTPGTPGPSDGPDTPGPGPGGPVVDGGDPAPTPPVPPVPPGPGGGPAAPPPPGGGCADGDEEWRSERPAESFLVPPPDGKVRITADPPAPALEAWLDGFGLPRGIPFDDFVAVDDPRLDELLAGLPAGDVELHWVIEFQLDEFRLECQRKWICEAGAYVPTDEKRLVEAGPDPYLARYAIDGPARSVADIRDAWHDARTALNGAEANVPAMRAYRSAC